MADRLTFSVIVASRNRPQWLARCLTALRQLDYPNYEVIVVSEPETLNSLDVAGCKRVPFDQPNISAARNAGIAQAAGDVCAFIDDDAVPEPCWLKYHAEALQRTDAAATVGYVRGRNGISFQSRVACVDTEAETHQHPVQGDQPFVPKFREGRALKLVGTNTAIRRKALLEIGGFDPSFAFYLDDTDVSLRLAQSDFISAVAPLAEVHHAFAPSNRRTNLRAPTDLNDIGRSSAVFLRRHNGLESDEFLARLMRREKARLIDHMVRGTCEPIDVKRRLNGLFEGWQAGMKAKLPSLDPMTSNAPEFQPIHPIQGHDVFDSRLLRRRSRLVQAEAAVAKGRRASLFSFSLTPIRHHVRYSQKGVWIQTGGQFGRADRNGPLVKWCRFVDRIDSEISRVEKQRGI